MTAPAERTPLPRESHAPTTFHGFVGSDWVSQQVASAASEFVGLSL